MKIHLTSKLAKVPTRANPWDAGADLYSIENVFLVPGARQSINTGVAIELPDSYVGYVCPRSGLASKAGISIVNAPGIIDSGYRGEIKVNLINLGQKAYSISIGDRIAQLVVQQCIFPEFENTPKLGESMRGTNGHGSSGK